MVLDAGNLVRSYLCRRDDAYSQLLQVEFAPPVDLLENKDGYFRSLVDASGDREKLYDVVKHRESGT